MATVSSNIPQSIDTRGSISLEFSTLPLVVRGSGVALSMPLQLETDTKSDVSQKLPKSECQESEINFSSTKGSYPVQPQTHAVRYAVDEVHFHPSLGRNVDGVLFMSIRQLVGRGRDGLVYRLGSTNIERLALCDKRKALGWGGFVVKVPRFMVSEVPQHYVRSLLGGFASEPRVVDRVRRAMDTNFSLERRFILGLWRGVSESYLGTLGFPEAACRKDTWRLSTPPKSVQLSGTLRDEGRYVPLYSIVMTNRCHVMPEALMDGFQAMMNHFSENLFLSFMRDITFQLRWLEDKRIVHGDIKLSNILLLTWQHKNYVFILADFWDAFSLSEEGFVEQLDPPRNHSDYEIRKLQRWKFHYEKFGTRIYKDPQLLDSLRDAVLSMKSNQTRDMSQHKWNHLILDAGQINMWSFLMVLVFMLTKKSKMQAFKTKIRDGVLYSGDVTNPPLRAAEAMEMIRQGVCPINSTTKYAQNISGIARSCIFDKETVNRSRKLSDEVRYKLKDLLKPSGQRPSADDIIDTFQLYSPSKIAADQRDIIADIGVCDDRTKCRVCHRIPSIKTCSL
eukprot:GHVH01003353.1.p1 GENE.GHVH01003353.1~~GHVH01003353.1.p1  ORF type:complete len:563 (+),score=58.26 GHVH01003353.1:5266-6954(+)